MSAAFLRLLSVRRLVRRPVLAMVIAAVGKPARVIAAFQLANRSARTLTSAVWISVTPVRVAVRRSARIPASVNWISARRHAVAAKRRR